MLPSVLALIPARGGSKGVPRKNLRLFHGRPLIAWAVAAACESGVAERVVVSTDDEEIAMAARQAGAEVPFLRTPQLARDDTPMLDVALDALDRTQPGAGTLLLLQPTSPLRTAEDLRQACALLHESADAVVSVTVAKHHPQWMQQMDREGFLAPLLPGVEATRRQDLPPAYLLNGAIFLVRTAALRQEQTFRPRRTIPYLMPAERSLDIDSEFDWLCAESVATRS